MRCNSKIFLAHNSNLYSSGGPGPSHNCLGRGYPNADSGWDRYYSACYSPVRWVALVIDAIVSFQLNCDIGTLKKAQLATIAHNRTVVARKRTNVAG